MTTTRACALAFAQQPRLALLEDRAMHRFLLSYAVVSLNFIHAVTLGG
jgi:hypothetical protein